MAVAVTLDEMQTLVGHRFPGGTLTIERWENVLLCEAMACEPPPDGPPIRHICSTRRWPAGGVLTGVREENGERLADCDVWLELADGSRAVDGRATVAL